MASEALLKVVTLAPSISLAFAAHAHGLALQVFKALDVLGGVLGDEDRKARLVEGVREEDALLAFFRDREARGAHVGRARHEGRDDAVEADVEDFDVVARLLGHGADQIHFKARHFLRFAVDEFKGREGRVRRDAQRGGVGNARNEAGGDEECGGEGLEHDRFPFGALSGCAVRDSRGGVESALRFESL